MTLISDLAEKRGVTRLCHLTPFRNLLQIASGEGIRSVVELTADQRSVFTRQDLERLDGHPDHISCSVQYPNAWYLRRKLSSLAPEQRFFPDWICLLIDIELLDRPDVLFSERNAAAAGGTLLRPGAAAFEAMFAAQVMTKNGMKGRESRPQCSTTDDQAEVMLPKSVPLSACAHVVVTDESQALRVYSALDLLGVPVSDFAWTIAPEIFLPDGSRMIRSGQLPPERQWLMDGADADDS